jgi:hypothetical protein
LELGLPAGESNRGGDIAEVVQDRTADVGASKGFKWGSLVGIEAFGSPDQPEQTHLEKIIHAFTATAAVMDGDGPHQILVGFNEAIALLQGKALPQTAIGGGKGHYQ